MKKVLLIAFLSLLLMQCDTETGNTCSTLATVRNLTGLDGCGWVFELEDGTRLEPYWQWGWCGTPPLPQGVTEDPLYNFEYVEGKKVLINYEEVNDVASICMVGPIVKITCLTEVGSVISEE